MQATQSPQVSMYNLPKAPTPSGPQGYMAAPNIQQQQLQKQHQPQQLAQQNIPSELPPVEATSEPPINMEKHRSGIIPTLQYDLSSTRLISFSHIYFSLVLCYACLVLSLI
jgi:hypothetical protein